MIKFFSIIIILLSLSQLVSSNDDDYYDDDCENDNKVMISLEDFINMNKKFNSGDSVSIKIKSDTFTEIIVYPIEDYVEDNVEDYDEG